MMAKKAEELARVHLVVEGWVQGVFFRASAVEEALKLGVKGWVRNCSNGSVEVTAEGSKEKIQKLVRWCHHGPPRAQVNNVQVHWQAYKGEFDSFRVRR